MTDTITIALISLGGAIIGSGGITAIVNRIISHKGKTAKQLDSIQEELHELDEKVERYEAQRARTQILRFADEMYEGVYHSKEHFECILQEAIPAYNQFCEAHPKFKNDQTIIAQKRILEVYEQCLKEHTFKEDKEDDQQ